MVLGQGGLGQRPLQVIPGQYPAQVPGGVDHLLPGGQLPSWQGAVGRLPAPQAVVAAAHRGDHRRQAPIATGEQGLNHAPAIALRSQLDAPGLEALGQQLQPRFRLGPHPLPLERRLGLGHKGAHPQGEAQARGGPLQLQQQLGGGLDVFLLLAGQARHAVELQARQTALLGMPCGGEDLLGGQLLVHQGPQAIAAALDGDRERLAAPLGQDSAQLWGDGGGPHRADAEADALEALAIQPLEQVSELGMLGNRGPQQTQAPGDGQSLLHRRDQALIEGGGAKGQGEVAGQAEAAQLRTAAHHLHHVDVGPGGLRGDHRRMAEGVAPPGLLGHAGRDAGLDRLHRQQLAVAAVAGGIERGHVDPRHLGQGPQPLGPRRLAQQLQSLHQGRQQQFAIAQQHHIKEGGQGLGIGGEHRPAAKHDRIAIAALVAPDRDALPLQQIEQHRPIQLPTQRQAKQIQLPMGGVPLVGEQPPHIQIRPLGQGGPDHLVTQAGDAHRIGAREGQHHPQRPGLGHGGFKQQGFLIQGEIRGVPHPDEPPRQSQAPKPKPKKSGPKIQTLVPGRKAQAPGRRGAYLLSVNSASITSSPAEEAAPALPAPLLEPLPAPPPAPLPAASAPAACWYTEAPAA